MAIPAFSPEWRRRFKDEINKKRGLQEGRQGLAWTVGLLVEAEPDKNFPSRGAS